MSRRLPSPALVISVLALTVALGGTAIAAGVVPLAKRSLVADNAKRLNGKTAVQVAKLAPPAEVASVAGLTSIKSQPWTLGARQSVDVTVTCDLGQKAIGGGWEEVTTTTASFDDRPSADGTGWRIALENLSATTSANGTAFAVCLK
jgi:hypothetical protein